MDGPCSCDTDGTSPPESEGTASTSDSASAHEEVLAAMTKDGDGSHAPSAYCELDGSSCSHLE